jgi:hypothetical protein
MCGIYSIINAHKILYRPSEQESINLFTSIIEYLSKKRVLKDCIIDGLNHKRMTNIMNDVIGDIFPIKESNKKNIYSVTDWWNIAQSHFGSGDKRVIILAVDGTVSHYTVIESVTDNRMNLFDSDIFKPFIWYSYKTINKSHCRMQGYTKQDKIIVFGAQSWFLGL